MYKDLIPHDFNMRDSVRSIEGKDKEQFLNFVRKMLQWLPEKRESARELLEDPWLSLDSIAKDIQILKKGKESSSTRPTR